MTNTLTSHKVEEGELPSGWAVSRLGDLAGLSPKVPGDLLEANTDLSFVPMAAVTEVSGEVELTQTIAAQEGKKRSLKYFADGDVIFAKITPCMENGKVARPSGLINGAAFGSTEFHVLRPTPAIDGDFLRLFLAHDDFRYEAERAMTGAVGQRRVPKKYLEDFPLPTPPLEEQERIVEILEDQLARLDTAVQSVHIVREKAAQFRRSLLNAAFTGALTGHDVEQGEVPKGWGQSTIGELASIKTGKVDANAAVEDGEHAFFTCARETYRINDAPYEGKAVLVAGNGDLNVKYYEGKFNAYQRTYFLFSRDESLLRPRYLYFFLDSYLDRLRASAIGTTVKYIRLGDLRDAEIPLMPLPEQDRIVEIVEDQLSRLDASLAVADAVEERSAALRRSLLHSAFTGRLTREWREAVNV